MATPLLFSMMDHANGENPIMPPPASWREDTSVVLYENPQIRARSFQDHEASAFYLDKVGCGKTMIVTVKEILAILAALTELSSKARSARKWPTLKE